MAEEQRTGLTYADLEAFPEDNQSLTSDLLPGFSIPAADLIPAAD